MAGRRTRAGLACRKAVTDVLKVGRNAGVPPFRVMDVIAAANAREAGRTSAMPHTIRMEVGQPGSGAPAVAVAAARRALEAGGALGYTEAFGRASLRARIAAHGQDWYGFAPAPSRIAVTMGASAAFSLVFQAAFDPGDRIAMAAPYYPPYRNIAAAIGLVPVILPTGPESRYQPTLAMLERLDPAPDGLIVASPSNPAGTMLHPDELAALARWCHERGVRLISDEIYHGLQYGAELATAAAFSPSAVVVNSFSKYFAMTGWRVGWAVLPEDLVRPVECLAQNLFISAPHLSQIAAEAAFDGHDELQRNVARYRRSRDLLLAGLPGAGFDRLSAAEGAFYVYADVSGRTGDSEAFCARMLAEAGVAAAAGVDFDAERGHTTLRLSYCGPEPDMVAALERLGRFH